MWMGQKMVVTATGRNQESITQKSDSKGKILATFFSLPFFHVRFYI